jgi:glucose/arabinose dehydrogenase
MTPLISLFALVCFTQTPWTIDYLSPPDGAVLEVGGMGFMDDGDMVVSTRRGQVWRIENPESDNPKDAIFTLICEGLHEGLGLAVLNNEIYVMQRSEVSKLLDLDGDQIIDEVQTITQDFGMSGNYHEFGFGLPVDREGNMYFSLNVGFWNPHWWHGKSRAPYRGWVLRLSPDGNVTPIAGGLRSPAGMGLLEDGTLLVTDNQGDWMAVCPVYAIKEGAFYGHPASLRWYDEQPDVEPSDTQPHPEITREHPVLWLPYKWSRSTGNVILDTTDGPFKGQYLIAELTNGQILRAKFEEIDGVLQGACWLAHQRVGSSYHIELGPDGTLYSGMTNRGWGGLAPGSGIARIKYNGELPLEMNGAHLVEDGFEISFTKPLSKAPDIHGEKYDYKYWWEYGSPKQHIEELFVENVTLAEDGYSVKVKIGNLEAGKCVMLKLSDASSTDGSPLLHTEVSYTINKMPGGALLYVAKETEPPIERGEEVEGWLYLTWADAFDLWSNNGVELCNAELDVNTPSLFVTSEGMGALVATEGEWMKTEFTATDGEIKMVYMLAEGAEAAIHLPNGMVYPLTDAPIDGYLSSGIWHNLLIAYSDDSIQQVEINGVIAERSITSTKSGEHTLQISSVKGNIAFGDVRIKQPLRSDSEDWSALDYDDTAITKNGAIEWTKSDAGDLVIKGTGTIHIPVTHSFTSIRFDTKFYGNGSATIHFGDLEVDVATTGERKTGGITGHPMHTNLIDQSEWCNIEIQQGESTSVLLNGILIIKDVDAPSMQGTSIQISIIDAELSVRRPLTKD